MPGAPDCADGDSATVGADRVHVATTYEPDALVVPLEAFVAVTEKAYVFGMIIDGDVSVRVEVPDAPAASDSDVADSVPVQPGGIDGSVRDTVNVPLAQPAESLFVTVTV